jgi:plastocyanin
MKIRTLLLFTVIFITAGASFHVHAEQKESGIVNGTVRAKKAKYLKDAVVYIENIPDTFEPKKEHAVIDQKNMAFIPHILPVIKGTTVDFLNSDLVQHNVYSPDDVADNVNLGTWLKGEVKSFTFGKLGVASIRCNVHVDMLAYVLVLQNPYFGWVNTDGSFSIPQIPAGKYTIKLWSERFKTQDKQVEVKSGGTTTIEFELK